MSKYAIAEIAGRQYRLEEGKYLDVPRLSDGEGDTITLDKLLLVSSDGDVKVGAPYVEGATAVAKVLEHRRGKKVIVFKMKRRKGYRKKAGAREHMTRLEVSSLSV